jgi:hypothetical protein
MKQSAKQKRLFTFNGLLGDISQKIELFKLFVFEEFYLLGYIAV